jgi:hypothetical protein
MLSRKLEAEIAVSLEKKQKSEQFRVIDLAKIPQRPIKPDVKKLFLMTIVIGFGLGCGLAYMMEFLDTSYRNPEDTEKELELPVLISLPFLYTEKELAARKKRGLVIASSIAIGFIIVLGLTVITAKGLGETVNFIKDLL